MLSNNQKYFEYLQDAKVLENFLKTEIKAEFNKKYFWQDKKRSLTGLMQELLTLKSPRQTSLGEKGWLGYWLNQLLMIRKAWNTRLKTEQAQTVLTKVIDEYHNKIIFPYDNAASYGNAEPKITQNNLVHINSWAERELLKVISKYKFWALQACFQRESLSSGDLYSYLDEPNYLELANKVKVYYDQGVSPADVEFVLKCRLPAPEGKFDKRAFSKVSEFDKDGYRIIYNNSGGNSLPPDVAVYCETPIKNSMSTIKVLNVVSPDFSSKNTVDYDYFLVQGMSPGKQAENFLTTRLEKTFAKIIQCARDNGCNQLVTSGDPFNFFVKINQKEGQDIKVNYNNYNKAYLPAFKKLYQAGFGLYQTYELEKYFDEQSNNLNKTLFLRWHKPGLMFGSLGSGDPEWDRLNNWIFSLCNPLTNPWIFKAVTTNPLQSYISRSFISEQGAARRYGQMLDVGQSSQQRASYSGPEQKPETRRQQYANSLKEAFEKACSFIGLLIDEEYDGSKNGGLSPSQHEAYILMRLFAYQAAQLKGDDDWNHVKTKLKKSGFFKDADNDWTDDWNTLNSQENNYFIENSLFKVVSFVYYLENFFHKLNLTQTFLTIPAVWDEINRQKAEK